MSALTTLRYDVKRQRHLVQLLKKEIKFHDMIVRMFLTRLCKSKNKYATSQQQTILVYPARGCGYLDSVKPCKLSSRKGGANCSAARS